VKIARAIDKARDGVYFDASKKSSRLSGTRRARRKVLTRHTARPAPFRGAGWIRLLETRLVRPACFLGLSLLILVLTVRPVPAANGESSPPRERATPVTVAPVVEKTVQTMLRLVGTADANRTSLVAAEVDGLVQKVRFRLGERVQAGAELLVLDPSMQQLTLQAAEAVKEQVNVRLAQARRDLERSAALAKTQTISAFSYEKDLSTVQGLEQELLKSSAEVNRLKDLIGRMVVRSPFGGYIVAQHTEVGQWLRAGSSVATLMDLSLVRVRVFLPERSLGEMNRNAPARVRFDAFPDEVFQGRVTAVIPAADQQSRNLPLDVSLPNPDGRILAGLTARVELSGRTRKVRLVPKDALVLNKDQAQVYVVEGDTVSPVQVTTGEGHDNLIEVSGDLAPGRMVVVTGNERLAPGQKIRVLSSAPTNQPKP